MKKFVPRDKLGKKARKEHDARNRLTWNGVNPVTKRIESKKLYNRKKTRREADELPGGSFSFVGRILTCRHYSDKLGCMPSP